MIWLRRRLFFVGLICLSDLTRDVVMSVRQFTKLYARKTDSWKALHNFLPAPNPVAATRNRARTGSVQMKPLDKFTGAATQIVPENDIQELEEPAAITAARALESRPLILPGLASGPIDTTFLRTKSVTSENPVVILHSFDSSCLELRRVMPLLEEAGIEAYAICILGWGFTNTSNAKTVSVEAKRAQLVAFFEQVCDGRPMTLVGTSLGCAAIIDLYANRPDAVHAAILCDPQGFIDGTPPVPEWGARAGIQLLGSWALRSAGQKVAYLDTRRLDTDDAIRVGRLHCKRAGWEEDQVEWLLSRGYSVSSLVPRLSELGDRCLILWGRQDRVLPPLDYVPKFISALPKAQFRWVEECGHCPHLEQPEVLAAAIVAFVRGQTVAGDPDASALIAAAASRPSLPDWLRARPGGTE